MANQIITNYCNADCDFCFAADSRRKMLKGGMQQMSRDEVRDWLDFTVKAGIKELRLLGGEPTLHPDFPEFVRLGAEAGCSVMVFSNGVMPDKARKALAALDPEVCTVVINFSAAVKPEDRGRWRDTLVMLGTRAMPGLTLTSPDFSLHTPVAMIGAFHLRKKIRLGLANPTWHGTNTAVSPKRYQGIAQTLYESSSLAAKFGISLEADCGFVRCMFGDYFEKLCENGFRYISRCTPVMDFCTGGVILPCFGLSNLVSLKRSDFRDAGEAYGKMNELLKPWHSFGIYPECTECSYFETEECCGGCVAARIRRMQEY